MQNFATALEQCLVCDGSLYIVEEKKVMAKVVGYRGIEMVKHIPKRCCRKSCRKYHWFNYICADKKKDWYFYPRRY